MNVKFSAIVFQNVFPFPDLSSPFYFDSETFVTKEPFGNFFDSKTNQHWKEWLGSLFWDDLTKKDGLSIITWKPSDRAEVVGDPEHEALDSKMNNLYDALILTGPWKNGGGEAHRLSGGGTLQNGGLKVVRIGQVGSLNLWRHSRYFDEDDIWKWQIQELRNPNILNEWKDNFAAINNVTANGAANFLFRLGILAFNSGLHDGLLDFRIPNFVRAIETVVALPPGKGKTHFSSRTRQLLPTKINLPLGIEIDSIGSILEECYQVRSDCVHGKPFADTLQAALGAAFSSDLPKYELGIEMAARLVLQRAIRSHKLLSFSGARTLLENAWATNQVP